MKKKLLTIAVLTLTSGITLADSATYSSGTGYAGAQSNLGVTQDFRNYSTVVQPPIDMSRAVGTAIAPTIQGSLITCMGGVSAGGGFAGGAFSIGTSIESAPCNLRQNAQLLVNLGEKEAARILMCTDDVVRKAYRLTATPCPQDNPELNMAQIKANSQEKQLKLQAEFDAKYHTIRKPVYNGL